MNSVLVSIGSIEIRWYSILILIGIILAYFFILKETKRFKISSDFVFNMLFWTIIFGFIGARLYFIVFNFHLYRNNLSDIFKVWEGGLAIHGGILFGILVIIYYSKRYNISLLRLLDIVSVPLLLAQSIGRWGNFFNQEAFGRATTLSHLKSISILPQFVIDGMKIEGIYYTPTFYYESLWCLFGFIVLLIIRRFKFIKIGQIAAFYMIWYGIGRFFIEASRTDSLMFMGYKVAQLVSVGLLITGLAIFIIQSRKSKFDALYNDQNQIGKIRY